MYIETVSDPSEKDADVLSRGIIRFNSEAIPDLEPPDSEKKFFVFAKSENGKVLGGIRATCFWNTLHIELLWLSEESRGMGIGKKLIEDAERHALQNQCENAFVETTSWQAKPFYERNGYKHMATLNNRPKGHASHYLSKSLVPQR
ncbi:MAG: GNAT family N-acetyltransferase [Parasphingopyxis sp.]